jgi:hypothetical protein
MGGNPTLYLLLLLVCGLVRCLGWFLYLRFCRYLVDKTGDPAALTQAATVARAFRGPRPSPPRRPRESAGQGGVARRRGPRTPPESECG